MASKTASWRLMPKPSIFCILSFRNLKAAYLIQAKTGGRSRPLTTKECRPMRSAALFSDDSRHAARLILPTSFCPPCGTNSAATPNDRQIKNRRATLRFKMAPPLSDALVLFGASGDLAHKKIFPALYAMFRHGRLRIPIVGVARSGWTNDAFKAHVLDAVGGSNDFDQQL